jgi:nitrile hydratase accessory protein
VADQLDVDGPAAPPRDNGELVFSAPWQGRAFAMAVALHEAGRFAWDDFRRELIAELEAAGDAEPATYWSAWLRAAETVLARCQLLDRDEQARRLLALAARPAGHDHDHRHGHG